MEKQFNSDEVPLAQLLGWAENGHLQLPDFQRGWVWDDDPRQESASFYIAVVSDRRGHDASRRQS